MGLLLSGKNPAAYKTAERSTFTATAGQTTFTVPVGYNVGDIDVFLNGLKLVEGDDFFAINGTTVVLASGANTGDSLSVVCYYNFLNSSSYTKAESDNRYLQPNGQTTMTSYLRTPNYGISSTSDSLSASLEASAFAGEQGVGIKAFGRSIATTGGDILYTADSRGAGGRHRFGYWNGSSFTTTMQLDSSGRLLLPNQPLFSAYYQGGSGSLSGIISYNTTKVSNTSAWNGSRFTAQVAGYYHFIFTGFMQNNSSQGQSSIYKNGSEYVRTYSNESAGVYRPFATAAIMRLEVNEYCESHSSVELHANANPSFCGFLIG